MESSTRVCILNASNGSGWYPVGTQRLVRSLINHGYGHDILTFDTWMNSEFDKNCPYNIKASAWHEALNKNYDIILWLDCSVWAINNPYLLLDIINHEGYYFWKSGFNCAQTVSDSCLSYFGVNRDTAETYTDVSTSMFGIRVGNPQADEFISKWIQAARDNQFFGSRLHDNQSSDPRFLFHRQDQSCASVIAGKMGLKVYDANVYSSYYPIINDSIVFTMRGM